METENEATLLTLFAHRLKEATRELIAEANVDGEVIQHIEIDGITIIGTGQRLVSTDPFKTEPIRRVRRLEVPIMYEPEPEVVQ